MAPTTVRHFRIDTERLDRLTVLAYDRHSTVAAEITAAADRRLALRRTGELPEPGARAKREHPADQDLYIRLSDERYDALGALAAERSSNVSKEIMAAIDDHLAAASAKPTLRDVPPADQPQSRPAAAEADCPHPKARRDAKNPNLCRACGEPVA
jgi:hypothetical protein